MELIDKTTIVKEIEKRIKETESMKSKFDQFWAGQISAFKGILKILDTLEVKEVDLESENENNTSKITVGTKIRSKTNPNVILSIISNDCHGDEFECSNGSVLSLKQIEKYYDLII